MNALCNYYTLANKRVAELCNHQKATSPAQMSFLADTGADADGALSLPGERSGKAGGWIATRVPMGRDARVEGALAMAGRSPPQYPQELR